MAVAPARRAASPSARRARGRRWARTSAASRAQDVRHPTVPACARSVRSPAADGAERAGDEETVAAAGPAAQHRTGPVVHHAGHGHATTTPVALDRSPPTTRTRGAATASATPSYRRSRSVDGGPATATSTWTGPATHGRDVAHGRGHRPPSQVVEAHERQVGVDPGDAHVGGEEGPSPHRRRGRRRRRRSRPRRPAGPGAGASAGR